MPTPPVPTELLDPPRPDSESAFDALQAGDAKALAEGRLTGRYLQEPYADGHAYYRITRTYRRSVTIERCTGLGDDWTIPYWGEKATIDRAYAEERLAQRDRITALFAARRG